ncbi:MAG: Anaerobic dimethyl sulfoxide reductase chain, partial [Verrucomicrobiota bacterium]
MMGPPTAKEPLETLIDAFLAEQRQLTAVERFSQRVGDTGRPLLEPHYRALLPATPPGPGEQYAFEVDLDQCSSCKACVVACHSL